MRAVIQRVLCAEVKIKSLCKSKIKKGLLIFLGIGNNDNLEDIKWLTKKIVNLRIFSNKNGILNNSVLDVDGDILIVSQFTLHANIKKGNRPSFVKAARPNTAIEMYEKFKKELSILLNKQVMSGDFGSDMQVSLTNDGPVTIIIDTKNKTF